MFKHIFKFGTLNQEQSSETCPTYLTSTDQLYDVCHAALDDKLAFNVFKNALGSHKRLDTSSGNKGRLIQMYP